MNLHQSVRRRQTTGLGRSGPRSRNGCQTCKLRRVRCDEKHPVCGHCHRLQLECIYHHPQRRRGGSATPSKRTSDHHDMSPISIEQVNTEQGPPLMANANGPLWQNNSQCSQNETHDSHMNALDMPLTSPQGGPMPPPDVLNVGHVEFSGAEKTAEENQGQYVLFGVSDTSSNVTLVNPGDMGYLSESPGDNRALAWQNNQSGGYADYIPVPDPPFSFTSLAFDSSPDIFELNVGDAIPNLHVGSSGQSASEQWFSPSTRTGIIPSSESQDAPDLDHEGSKTPTGPTDHAGSKRHSNRQSPAISAPLLTKPLRQMLLTHFERDVRPPASLAGVDPLGWFKIKGYVLRRAKGGNELVTNAFFALTTLLSALDITFQSTINRYNYKLLAIRLQHAACSAMKIQLLQRDWATKDNQNLLISVFLLAWFEIAYDDEDQTRPLFPTDIAEKIIVEGAGWSQGSRHLFQWLNLLDSKMSHLGGRHFFSESALRVLRQYRPEASCADTTDEDEWDGSSVVSPGGEEQETTNSKATGAEKQGQSDRLEYLLASRTPSILSSHIIRMDIFNIILHPTFEFHLTSMTYARRIGSHDRHHRSRDTPQDEFEVMTACRGFEDELQELWRRRPGILNLDSEKLKEFVSPDIARGLERLFSVYIATFWSHFIYIHRVAYWSLKHTPIVEKALQETGNMMRRSVGQSMQQLEFDTTLPRTPANVIHPGLMWTCMIFGCEVTDPIQQDWCVSQLKALGELDPSTYKESSDPFDDLSAFRLDKKGAQNALKISKLLRLIIQRQGESRARVDGKYVSQELFGCSFYFI
ncbi:hypothetical protein BX600DRAFT_414532 [Xylariales sp. PMI_506]|nr:hypothetical protein BX600DRAFT_414532 [Xylariales sp. PMI_506]